MPAKACWSPPDDAGAPRGAPNGESSWRTPVTVATVVEREGRFLMVEEIVRGRTVWNQPAGHLDPGETPVQAAARETLEETGWTVIPEGIVGVYLYRPGPRADRTFTRFLFHARAVSHAPDRPLDDGIIRAHWKHPEELGKNAPLLRSPLVLAAVQDYLAGRRYPLDLIRNVQV